MPGDVRLGAAGPRRGPEAGRSPGGRCTERGDPLSGRVWLASPSALAPRPHGLSLSLAPHSWRGGTSEKGDRTEERDGSFRPLPAGHLSDLTFLVLVRWACEQPSASAGSAVSGRQKMLPRGGPAGLLGSGPLQEARLSRPCLKALAPGFGRHWGSGASWGAAWPGLGGSHGGRGVLLPARCRGLWQPQEPSSKPR